MPAIKVTLKKAIASASEDQLRTVQGLGLRKFGDTKLLPDTPEVRGAAFKVKHLVSMEKVDQEFKKRVRSKPKKIVRKEASRAKAAAAAK
ncbi:MAG: 50S ribosomal protein L30 [Myxococcota bacterium]|nr:50S ribosomal protein L30 [Myxococcota bacterium]